MNIYRCLAVLGGISIITNCLGMGICRANKKINTNSFLNNTNISKVVTTTYNKGQTYRTYLLAI